MCGKTRNIVIQLVLHHCCVTSCEFFVARFPVALVWHAENPPLLLVTQPAGILGKGPSKASASRELQETSIRGILCSPQGEPVPVSKIMMYSRAVESDAKNARGMGRDRTVPSPDRSRLICAWIVLSRHVPTIWEPGTGYPRNTRSLLTRPHMMIPDSNAISNVSTNTGHPDRTELNTAFAEVPGGSSTTMNATPGDPIRGMNLYEVW